MKTELQLLFNLYFDLCTQRNSIVHTISIHFPKVNVLALNVLKTEDFFENNVQVKEPVKLPEV